MELDCREMVCPWEGRVALDCGMLEYSLTRSWYQFGQTHLLFALDPGTGQIGFFK